MKKFKIVADSSADLFELKNVPLSSAPLKIVAGSKEFVDDQNLNLEGMVDFLLNYKGKSSTSCPNPEDWLSAFEGAKNVFCIPITATLSGSYNAAITAKELYLEKHPDRNVFVANTLSAGPELKLISEKIEELILQELEFDEICEKINKYMEATALVLVLESMKNLAINGRVSSIVAKAAGLLGIRVVGKASAKGDLEPLSKCRGEEKALRYMADFITESGCKNGKIRIAHCFNQNAAETLKQMILKLIPNAQIELYSCAGLCSFYAEKGGMLVGFEKF